MPRHSHLIAKRVTDKRGFSTTVYVRPEPETGLRSLNRIPSRGEKELAGTHWEDARNPRLSALVKKKKRTATEKMDASFSILIANKGGSVVLGAPDELDAEEIYMMGGCAAFAYAAAMISDRPIAVFDSKDMEADDSWSGHVALEISPGRYLDILGEGDRGPVNSYFNRKVGEPIIFDTPEDVQRHMNSSFTGNISDYVHTHIDELGWLVTLDFAQNVLAENGIAFDESRLDALEADTPRRN